MTLSLLIVEDDDDIVDELREIIAALPCESQIRVAGSLNEALSMIEEGFLDLVILDLKIPTVTRALDADPAHGRAVFDRIRALAPGTPIFVLTGSPAEDFILESILKNQRQVDIWSEGRENSTIHFQRKYNIDQCCEILRPMASAIDGLSDVELERDGLDLSPAEDRLIRIFSKRFQGARCVVSQVHGGLSGARIIRLRVTDSQGAKVHDAIAKISKHAKVREESDRYDKQIARLDPAATPRKLEILEFGAHTLAGIFFGLAEGFGESLFDVADDPQRSQSVIRKLKSVTAPWRDEVPQTRRTIARLRQRVMDDQSLRRIRHEFDLDWIADFEKRRIQTRWACCHGDLHGGNVLVSQRGVVLIDYGDVGDGPASLDPITLELSLLFHPDAPDLTGEWPSNESAQAWGNLDVYLQDCPFAQFVRECRSWAIEVAAGKREVAASAYAYVVRQLKYCDTNKDRVLALLRGVQSFYDSST